MVYLISARQSTCRRPCRSIVMLTAHVANGNHRPVLAEPWLHRKVRSVGWWWFIYLSVAHVWSKMWRPCNFTPPHTLTGPVGQPFASCLGGQWFASRDAQTHNGTWVFLLALSRYIADPNMIDHLGSMPTMGSFTKLRTDNVKSQLWSHIAFPSSIPLLAGPPPPCNTVTG